MISNFAYIAAAIGALALGPLLYRAARSRSWALGVVNGFVLTSVAGLVLFYVLPDAIAAAGWWILVPAFVGLLLPLMMERAVGLSERFAHSLVLWVALGGLIIHTVLDGFALVEIDASNGAIALAVVLHRLPVGLAIWTLVVPRFGARMGWGALGVVALGTLVGVAAGDALGAWASASYVLAGFQALVAGSLLHVVVHEIGGHEHHHHHDHGHDHDHDHDHGHDHDHDHDHDHGHDHGKGAGRRVAEGLGAFLGVGLVLATPLLIADGHDHGVSSGYGHRLLDLSLESAPALLIGFVLAGVVGAFLPSAKLGVLGRGSRPWQAAKGAAVGVPLPICSCGVVPLYESLVRRGVPPTAAMAFFVATPEIGIESLLLTIPLLGVEFTIARFIVAALVALIVGTVVGSWVKNSVEASSDDGVIYSGSGDGWQQAVSFTRDVVDDTAAWILAGLLIAAAFDPGSMAHLASLPGWLEVFVFAVVGIPVYVCASGATPVAAALIFAGVSPGAGLAFLVAGPATNVTTFGVLSKLHGTRVALAFGVSVVVLAVISGVGLNAVWGWGDFGIPELGSHEHASAVWGAIQWASLSVIGLVFADSILRQGPGPFLAEVLEFGESHHHDHAPDSDSCC